MASESAPKIYGLPMSTHARRVYVTLYEMGQEQLNLEAVDLIGGEHKRTPYLEKQPFGLTPVYHDDAIQLYESRAISRYLVEKYGGQAHPLVGETAVQRALVNQWLDVEAMTFNPPISGLVRELLFKPVFGAEPDLKAAQQYRDSLASVLDVYEIHLAKQEYLAGSFFSLADLSHLPFIALLWHVGHSDVITTRPNVFSWWKRISSRPAWKKTQLLQNWEPLPSGAVAPTEFENGGVTV